MQGKKEHYTVINARIQLVSGYFCEKKMTSMLLLARVTPVVLVCSIIVCEARGRVEQSRFVQELIGDSDHVNLRTPRTVDGYVHF